MEKKLNKMRTTKGITVVALVITVIILIMITTTMAMGINARYQSQKLDKLSSDLKLLKDKVLIYQAQNGQYPIVAGILQEESETQYQIDLSKLEGLTLNYGNGEGDDIYLIDISTGIISYKKGIEYKGEMYHSLIVDNEITDIEGALVLEITDQIIKITDENGDATEVKVSDRSYVANLEIGNTLIISVETNLDEIENITYQWYRNDKEISGATNSSYEISELEDEDIYYCEIMYEGVSKNSARVIVNI